jgi:hypothetical protein
VDFGGTSSTYILTMPGNMRATWLEALVYKVTENFAGTTKASIDCGDGSDADGFGYTKDFVDAEMTTATGGYHFSRRSGTINEGALGWVIEAADKVTMTCNAGVTTPTGIGRVSVSFMYFE